MAAGHKLRLRSGTRAASYRRCGGGWCPGGRSGYQRRTSPGGGLWPCGTCAGAHPQPSRRASRSRWSLPRRSSHPSPRSWPRLSSHRPPRSSPRRSPRPCPLSSLHGSAPASPGAMSANPRQATNSFKRSTTGLLSRPVENARTREKSGLPCVRTVAALRTAHPGCPVTVLKRDREARQSAPGLI